MVFINSGTGLWATVNGNAMPSVYWTSWFEGSWHWPWTPGLAGPLIGNNIATVDVVKRALTFEAGGPALQVSTNNNNITWVHLCCCCCCCCCYSCFWSPTVVWLSCDCVYTTMRSCSQGAGFIVHYTQLMIVGNEQDYPDWYIGLFFMYVFTFKYRQAAHNAIDTDISKASLFNDNWCVSSKHFYRRFFLCYSVLLLKMEFPGINISM